MVDEYGGYVHGHPFQKRYVVLDREKLESHDGPMELVVVEDASQLTREVCEFLQGRT